MVKKQINRKEFITKTLSGIAGLGLISESLLKKDSAYSSLTSLGDTGIMVTSLCFGATRTNEESLIRYGISKGINFIDTGRSYANGNNEKIVGQAVKDVRRKIIIQSKIRLEEKEIPARGKGRKGAAEIKEVLSAKLEESLKALDTDYIDIMLYHDAVEEDLLFHDEVLRFFSDMKSARILNACGFSTHNDKINLVEKNNVMRSYDSVMVPFNHKGSFIHSQTGSYSEWDQEKLIAALSEAGKKGIGVVAMKTCSGGKYSPSPSIVPSYNEAVRWVISHEFVTAAAVALSSFEQIDEYTSI